MTCWVGSFHSSYHSAKFVGLAHCESKDQIFLICRVTTRLICYVTLWVESLHPSSHHPSSAKFGLEKVEV